MTLEKPKKKILYIVTQSEFGGAQRYLYELITHFDPQKYDITVAAGPGGDFLDSVRLTPEFIQGNKAQNFKIWRLKHLMREINPIKDFKAYFELKNLIYAIKPDILQLCSTKAGIIGALAYKSIKKNDKWQMLNGKCLYRIGGWAFTEDLPFWKKWLYIKAEKWTAKYKDIIINNCEAQRQLAIKLKIAPPQKIITIYNGLDLTKLTFLSKTEAREKVSPGSRFPVPGSLVIGTIANFYKNKGLEYLIKAISALRLYGSTALWLIIIGDGSERPNLENLIRELKLENQVLLPGQLKNAHQYLKAFDLFVLPSIKEGQPWTILEAMAAEVPIIATRVAAIPEMLKDNESGLLVPPKNPKAIAEKIQCLIQNPAIAETLTHNARQILEQKFTIQKMVEQTKILYEQNIDDR